jgi:hypothetical protein
MPPEFGSHHPRPFANSRGFSPQFRIGHHFFDVAKAIGPFAEAAARERPRHVAWHIVLEGTGAAAEVAAIGLTLNLPPAALAGLPRPAWGLAILLLILALTRLTLTLSLPLTLLTFLTGLALLTRLTFLSFAFLALTLLT